MEVFSPRISQLLGLCCHAFTKEQLCNLECLILLRLHFRLAAPTLAFFLEYNILCSEAAGPPPIDAGSGSPSAHWQTESSPRRGDLARRICELSLADYAFNRYLPSLTAACAMTLSLELLTAGGEPDESIDPIQSETGALSSGTFESELPEDEQSPMDSGPPDQPGDGPGRSADGFGPEERGSLSGGGPDGGPSHSQHLALECTENLKLLVSLNRETLQSMLTTS